jgi:hypothetical protein
MALAIGAHRLAVRLCMQRVRKVQDGKETWYRAIAECGDYGALSCVLCGEGLFEEGIGLTDRTQRRGDGLRD